MPWQERKSALKKEAFYVERDEEKRAAFDEELASLPSETNIVYIDECGINKQISRDYGRSPVGERVFLPVNGRRDKKLNIIAGLLNGKLISPTKYDWNTNSEWFLEWFEWFLLPVLPVGSVIILDNASFHKKTEVHRIVKSYGCCAIFLPPYSPDKNKIEKSWANLKNWLRLNAKRYAEIQEAVSVWIKSE